MNGTRTGRPPMPPIPNCLLSMELTITHCLKGGHPLNRGQIIEAATRWAMGPGTEGHRYCSVVQIQRLDSAIRASTAFISGAALATVSNTDAARLESLRDELTIAVETSNALLRAVTP